METRISNISNDYDLSPRSSVSSLKTKLMPEIPPVSAPALPASQPLVPSIRLLFSLFSPRRRLCLLLPAIASSVIAGAVAPFMTYVVGQASEGFVTFPLGPNPPQAAKDALLRSVGLAALELLSLAVGSVALSSITSSLWIWAGEHNAMQVRKAVYNSIAQKDMAWFDTQIDGQDAGGMMAKFTRDTNDIRMATSLAAGSFIQYLTTALACLILAFIRSWALTLVILSPVPFFILIQSLSQSAAAPRILCERLETTSTATLVDRALTAISTVKAFNAQDFELRQATHAFKSLEMAVRRLLRVWGPLSAFAQFVIMAMFVQGIWFASLLIREGKLTFGDYAATFWACLIATSNLSICIPQFIIIVKGKFTMAALMETMINDPPPSSPSPLPLYPPSSATIQSPPFLSRKQTLRQSHRTLRKITPIQCYGEFAFHDVTFSYPSKPYATVLSNVSLYLPANETTFIVGSSGSGKSTIAALLMNMYETTFGTIMLDDQDMRYLDHSWLRGQIAGVSQGFGNVVVLDGQTIWENVAVGAYGRPGELREVKKEEVEKACRMAMVHEFVKDLPDGYDTKLGSSSETNSVTLSGGQRQRLALARARIRNPTILILDEATSALDPTSRILVFEAIKRWRKNKTTIVITHDLSQIQSQDFVYVLKNGRVVEQGYRADLEHAAAQIPMCSSKTCEEGKGEFFRMMESQRVVGGLPAKNLDAAGNNDDLDDPESYDPDLATERQFPLNDAYSLLFGRSSWMFDAVADLTSEPSTSILPDPAVITTHSSRPFSCVDSRLTPVDEGVEEADEEGQTIVYRPRRPSSALLTPTTATTMVEHETRLYDAQFSPKSPALTFVSNSWKQDSKNNKQVQEEDQVGFDIGQDILSGPLGATRERVRRNKSEMKIRVVAPGLETMPREQKLTEQGDTEQPAQFWKVIRRGWPIIPHKPLLILGLFICVASGSLTPIFSYILSLFMSQVSIDAQNASRINVLGGIALSVTALDGVLLGFKYYFMESYGMSWATHLRIVAYDKVLRQDKTWFDKSKNTPARLNQVIVQDGDDARVLLSVVIGQCFSIFAMLSLGLLWAMAKGWELTLVGLGILPVFTGIMSIQTKLVSKYEIRNKRAREEVARRWYDVMYNIKGIRAMGIAQPFSELFDISNKKTLKTGVNGAWIEGATMGITNGLVYAAQAVLFYVGAVLLANGRYSYSQMIEVLNLVVFSVSLGSQLMTFTDKISKATQATHDLLTLTELSTHDTSEAKGFSHSFLASGPIVFDRVSFAYPSRPSNLVLNNFSLRINHGECIALVGASGSGKSTVASLLQRLYEPLEGQICFGGTDIKEVDTRRLRNGLGVVSQAPQLFESASVEDNILYGISPESFAGETQREKIIQRATRFANIDWLDDADLKAPLGEVSGGQAQRIQIARSLARSDVHLLIFDECTSALDGENQRQVLDAIMNVRRMTGEENQGLKMVIITHKTEVMQMCDRVVVVKEGKVCEEGVYEELIASKGGVLRELARGGIWEA